MADYLYLRKATSSSESNFYQNGVTAYTREGIGAWKAAYYSDITHVIKMGVYRESGSSVYTFVFTCSEQLALIDIKIVSPTLVLLRQVTSINREAGNGLSGYYGYTSVLIDDPIFNYTEFRTLNETLTAMLSSEPPSGVVVTVNASPVQPDPQPETEGVVVTVLARLADPNDQGGTSEQGGGHGTFDDTSDSIPPSSIPDYSCTNSGLVTLFRPTQEQLSQLGSYLWTNITDFIENLNKLFMNPMDYLIALNIFPVVPSVGSEREIKIGSFTTSITMPPVISQWVDFDCGSIMIPEYWGSYLDYAPYTKIHAMLPFVGSVQLNTDEVMNKMLSLRYRIDLLSGMCVAMILIDNNVYYQFTGECGVTVPLTGADWSRVYSAAIGAIGTAITAGVGLTGQTASTGATAALAQAKSSEAVASNVGAFGMLPSGVRGVQAMREHAEQAAQMALQAGQNAANIQAGASGAIRASAIVTAVNGTVNQVMSGKAHIQHSGTLSGSAALLGVRTAYVMLEYPNQSLPESYKHFVGYPSNMKATLGSLSGYTECEQVIVGALPNATDGEREELITALKGGVYL